jgi:hypothetical protein
MVGLRDPAIFVLSKLGEVKWREREREWVALTSVLSLVQGSWVYKCSFGISSLCCILVPF